MKVLPQWIVIKQARRQTNKPGEEGIDGGGGKEEEKTPRKSIEIASRPVKIKAHTQRE